MEDELTRLSYSFIKDILNARRYKIPYSFTLFIYGKELYDEHSVSIEPLTFGAQNYFVLIHDVTQEKLPTIIQTVFVLLQIFDEDKKQE